MTEVALRSDDRPFNIEGGKSDDWAFLRFSGGPGGGCCAAFFHFSAF